MNNAKLNQHGKRDWIAIALFSAGLLIPCMWQSRIQSADLASHIYNAWLAVQIHHGAAPGLWISSQSTNVLFDVGLEWLLAHVGPSLAQRIAVSISVLIFGWGALRFIFRVSGRNWGFAAPCVAMLAYGYIFHMGFFNFYLSLGLCLWYLEIIWAGGWKRHALAAPLLMIAWLAHPIPVVWAIGTAAYVVLANRVQPLRRPLLLIPGLAILVIARCCLTYRYTYMWSLNQISFISGTNEVLVFGFKYAAPFAALLLLWLIAFRNLVKHRGMIQLLQTIPMQLWLLNAAVVVLIPDSVMFPHYGRPVGFISARLSLMAGLMLCALLAAAPLPRPAITALVAVAIICGGLVYVDNRNLNAMEDRIDAAVSRLPPKARVISSLLSKSLGSLCLQHDLDRACIGHCYSYANYEPPSRQFRVRARPGNGIVMDNFLDADAVATGTYIVQARDLPLFLVYVCGSDLRDVCSRPLQAGERVGE